MKKSLRLSLILVFIFVYITLSIGQKTSFYYNPESEYRLGIDLFDKEKFGAAREKFDNVLNFINNTGSELRINAEYYDAICALELFNSDAEYKLNQFMINHPTNSRVNLISFQLGRLTYRNKKYNSAQKYFSETDINELNNKQLSEYYFKSGYCYFKTKKMQEAKQAFMQINNDTKYSSPSNYYLSHIAYIEGDFENALEGFTNLLEDNNFKSIAPYYIVQIQFMQKKYEQVLEMAPDLLINATKKRKPEITRIIGESYYRTSNYKKALPYLREYKEAMRTLVSREDEYVIGYTLFETENYDDAIKSFQRVTGKQDSLSQYAFYYLAASYLETGRKKFAANAFKSAYKLQFDKEIREDALFHQAQLAYELSYDPYNEAIRALKEYLNNYPNSSRNDEAYNFLVKISISTKNYSDALEFIKSIRDKGEDYNKNYQQITFYRGIELFNQFNYQDAIEMFSKATEINVDKLITAESIFWKAEAYYNLQNFTEAQKYYMKFLSSSGAKKIPVYNIANYNLGYVYFKRKEYSGAIYHFKQFIAKLKDEDPTLKADAFLRMGDSWFISSQYDNALTYYDKAIKMNALDMDYALFQKAVTLGVLLRYNEKIQALKAMVSNYPKSAYTSEALYELGNTYLIIHDIENALLNFRKIANDYPNSSFAKKSRLKTGLIYYNSNQNEIALNTFKGVVNDYPATPESIEALGSIKNIYIDMNKVDEFFKYSESLSFASVSVSEQDSISYLAAENLYLDGDCENSVKSLQNYIERFQDGTFKIRASYYLAECLVKNEELEKALGNYEFVADSPQSEFTERAVLKAAGINFTLEKYDTAVNYYTKLENIAENKTNISEAIYGQMKCNYLSDKYEPAVVYSDKVLSAAKISDERKLEAMQVKARSLLALDELLLAKSGFRDIVSFSQGEAGAEAKYNIAKIEFMLHNFEEAEKVIFELIEKYAAYDYWVANGFILLSDNYLQTGNLFQAKQTLQSIIDNYEGEDLKKIAMKKLDEIILQENTEEKQNADENEYLEADTIKIE
ncbi:MAG: tetratricopeptide repeat protein [Bacteroidales bacterium]|nr:tetratricopeptide repeat protein [Bacteroidales bacterium]